MTLEIIYEDEWLVAVNKPSGMLVHRGWARDGDIAVDVLHKQLGKHVWPLHRLDRATSGALLFALDVETARTLSHEFEHGRVGKRYLALVRGVPPEELFIDHALRRVDSDSSKRPSGPDGPERLPAQTKIHRLAIFERYALVEATPLTGRTHQIRRHLKHASHPIIGDVRYGKGRSQSHVP